MTPRRCKDILCAAFLIAISASLAQAQVVTIGYDPAKPGTYRVRIVVAEDGTATVSPITIDYVLGDPTGPTDPPDPPPLDPTTSKGLAAQLTTAALVKSGSTATTAKGLAIVYDRVGKSFAAGDLDATKAAKALREGSIGIVQLNGDPPENWQPMLAGLELHVTQLRQLGKFNSAACDEIEAGIEVPLSRAGILDNIDLDKLIEFILLIIKLITSLG